MLKYKLVIACFLASLLSCSNECKIPCPVEFAYSNIKDDESISLLYGVYIKPRGNDFYLTHIDSLKRSFTFSGGEITAELDSSTIEAQKEPISKISNEEKKTIEKRLSEVAKFMKKNDINYIIGGETSNTISFYLQDNYILRYSEAPFSTIRKSELQKSSVEFGEITPNWIYSKSEGKK